MAVSTVCAHLFSLIKTDNTLLEWRCSVCQSGPHWMIYECRFCRTKSCRGCIWSAY